jgi:hypothetical protein
MMQCEILVTTPDGDGQYIGGIVTLDGTTLSQMAAPGEELMMSRLMMRAVIVNGGDRLFAKDDPVKWFDTLPSELDSSLVRARMVPTEDDSLRMLDLAVELNMDL